ncbi:urease subunit beta [Patulibacter defluvii]|uniref:urease subunit beta n=1 Tax=Patulibacter defluvii TaxID=3095358 RepID=UPI002A763AD0|nr:urease subunit beta [Patulibacter sp. DM4]
MTAPVPSPALVPGELLPADGDVPLRPAAPRTALRVTSTADRPIQVGSHFHFLEVNRALRFDRAAAYGMRLAIPAGTAVRFEPGEVREVELVPLGGARVVRGFHGLVDGPLDDDAVRARVLAAIRDRGFLDRAAEVDAEAEAADGDGR